MLKVVFDYPPNINEIRKFFNIRDNAVFCWGGTIYNPKGVSIDSALMAHEQKHSDQQSSYGTDKLFNIIMPQHRIKDWWHRYLRDKAFRLSQELPAYQIQYKEYKKIIKDKNKLFEVLRQVAIDLSGETYGKIIDFNQAMEAIKNKEEYEFRV